MKKFLISLFVLTGIFSSAVTYAQTESQDLLDTPTVQSFKVYCEIVSSIRNIFSNKTDIELDFGQTAGFWSNDRKLVDENGEVITFNSVLDAVNYMARRGWEFEQLYIVQHFTKGDSGIPSYHWIMSKTVTDLTQITDGLRTQGMNK